MSYEFELRREAYKQCRETTIGISAAWWNAYRSQQHRMMHWLQLVSLANSSSSSSGSSSQMARMQKEITDLRNEVRRNRSRTPHSSRKNNRGRARPALPVEVHVVLQQQVLVIQSRCSPSGPVNGQDRRCEGRVLTQKYRQDSQYRRRWKCPKSLLKWLMFCQDHIKVGNIKLHSDSSSFKRCPRWRLAPASDRQERSCQFAPSCTQFGAHCLYLGTSRLYRCQVRRLFLRRVFPSWSSKVQSRRRDRGCPSGGYVPTIQTATTQRASTSVVYCRRKNGTFLQSMRSSLSSLRNSGFCRSQRSKP